MTLSKRRYPDWSSQPEAGGQMPSDSGPDIEEWKHILEESYGRIAEDIAQLRRQTAQAADHSARIHVGFNDLGLFNQPTNPPRMFQVPDGDWRSVIVSRPSYNEFFGNAFYSNDIYLVFDGQFSLICSYQGVTIGPYLGWKTVFANSNSGVTPNAKWGMDVYFSTREYPASAYTGF